MPSPVDSLLVYMAGKIRINIPSGDTAAWVYELNVAIDSVCKTFDAFPQLVSVIIREDSTGAALPADFLRVAWVQKIFGNDLWVPMGEVGGDTTYLAITDTSDTKLDKKGGIQPRLYFIHGVSDTARMFTQPKVAKDTFIFEFVVAYYARDSWIRQGDSTKIKSEFRPAVIDIASQAVLRSRGVGQR